MTRFSDDRVREETPHNPLARSKRQDDTQVKIGVKELMSQISNLTTESDDVAKLDGSDDPRLKRLLQPVVERNKKSIAIFEQASQLLRDAERFKANAQADVERRVEERVDRVCRHREDAFEEGEKAGVKRAESELSDMVNELREKYRATCWVLAFSIPFLAFFIIRALIDLIGG